MEKPNSDVLNADEYVVEQWEVDNAPANLEALKRLRRHMPVRVRSMSEAQLANQQSPNGKYLPRAIAKKFKRTNVLQLIRRHPDDIERMHPSTLENLRVTGMTLTENRAVYEHLKSCGPKWYAKKAEEMTERKWLWFKKMKDNFQKKLALHDLQVAQYGPPGAHPYGARVNPNDKSIDYEANDYGYTDEAVYEMSEVQKADVYDRGEKAADVAFALRKEKLSHERIGALKKHYKGKLLNVAKANASCESMDEILEKIELSLTKWIKHIVHAGDDVSKLTDDNKKKEVGKIAYVLNDIKVPILGACTRSGIQTLGEKTDEGEEEEDPRSIVECCLAEELFESFDILGKYVEDRLKETDITGELIMSEINNLYYFLGKLHERNLNTIEALGLERLPLSRKLKTSRDIEKEIKDKMKGSG